MKSPNIRFVLLSLLLFTFASSVQGQSSKDALVYLKEVSAPSQQISVELWEYIKAAAHSKNMVLIESRRKSVISSIEKAILTVNQVKAYQGERKYKDAVLKFLNTMYSVSKQDYAKIVDMEEVAEQSYDLMEAYLLAKKRANEKLKEAGRELQEEEQAFAKSNNITLTITEDEITKNLKKAGEVMDYYNTIYLIFFRSYKQEAYLLDAMQKQDVNKVEQNRLTLAKYAKEGQAEVSKLKPFENDSTLIQAAQFGLRFYATESTEKVPVMTDFLLKKDQFADMKKAFDLKKPEDRTKEDVDSYNAKVKEVNALASLHNKTGAEINEGRKKTIDGWNGAGETFFNNHVPK